MIDLRERLRSGGIIVGDGAMGTLLFENGLAPGACPESFNLDRADLLERIAADYVAAGAAIVETNTFGGSPLKLAHYGLADRATEINRRGVEAARAGSGGAAMIAGSVGPSGRIMKPYGDLDPADAIAGFRIQIAALLGAGADLLVIETMTDLVEARCAIRAARDLSPSIPILATMSFDPTPRGFFTLMGVGIPEAAAGLIEAGADAVGSNCGHGIDTMVEIARAFRASADGPLVIQSNAGLPRMENGRAVYTETPEFMAARLPALAAAGVAVVGGCCGTTPAHIRALRDAVDSLPRP